MLRRKDKKMKKLSTDPKSLQSTEELRYVKQKQYHLA